MTDRDEARADAHSAIVTLQLLCYQANRDQPAWTQESPLEFVELAKQQLHVVALATPFLPKKDAP